MAYKCAVCGKIYDSIEERIACETACVEKQKHEAAEAARADLEQKKAKLLEEIKASIAATEALVKQYREQFNDEPPVSHWYKTINPSVHLGLDKLFDTWF